MTNGEKMQETFPKGKTRKCRDGVVFESDGWCHAYDSDWWNTEYKGPTTKNNLAVDKLISDCEKMSFDMEIFNKPLKVVALDAVKNIVKDLSPVTPQEPILDKIRAEIEKLQPNLRPEQMTDYDYAMVDVINDIVAIIDKYKAENNS